MKATTKHELRLLFLTAIWVACAFALLSMMGCEDRQPQTPQLTHEQQAQLIKDALAELERVRPTPPPSPTPTPAFLGEVIIENPFDTPEERAAKANRRGIIIVDEKGAPWARLRREDNEDITRGLPKDKVLLESTTEPIVTKEADGWRVRFAAPDKPSVEATP